jgi:hypothetical protein
MDPDPPIFAIDLEDVNKKIIFSTKFFASFTFTSFSKTNSQKKSQSRRNHGFSNYFCLVIEGSGSGSIPLTNGSGSGSRRPKNIRIRRIRIQIRIRIRYTGLWPFHQPTKAECTPSLALSYSFFSFVAG